jgi:hypothetical protein
MNQYVGRPFPLPLSTQLKLLTQRRITLRMWLQEEEHELGVPAAKVRMAKQDIEGDDRRARLPALIDPRPREAIKEHDALSATAAKDGKPGAKVVP